MPPIIFSFLIILNFLIAESPLWPTNASREFSSNFGEFRSDHFHMGIDIRSNGNTGAPVFAVSDGFISRMVTNYSGFGKALYLTTDDDHIAVYGHLQKFITGINEVLLVQQKQKNSYFIDLTFGPREFPVKKGDIIGYMGDTGYSMAPHLHFEYRNKFDQPLNPSDFGFSYPDHSSPVLKEFALIPLTQGSLINANPLPQTFPLFLDKSGTYLFPDTINCRGKIGFAVSCLDKIQGLKYKYQVKKLELLIDQKPVFSIEYDKLDYRQKRSVNTIRDYRLSRLNMGSFHKMYRRDKHPVTTIHNSMDTGEIFFKDGYHDLEIKVWDSADNVSSGKGVLYFSEPGSITLKSVQSKNGTTSFILVSEDSISIKQITSYSFTPFGFADEQIEAKMTVSKDSQIEIQMPSKAHRQKLVQFIIQDTNGRFFRPVNWDSPDTPGDLLTTPVEVTLSIIEEMAFIQVEIYGGRPEEMVVHLQKLNSKPSVNFSEISPNVFISEGLNFSQFEDVTNIEIILKDKIERIVNYNLNVGVIGNKDQVDVLSLDKQCSIRVPENAFYDSSLVWIEKVEKSLLIENGNLLSRVYQLQPYDIPLKTPVKIGLKYSNGIKDINNMAIFSYNKDDNAWEYHPTKNILDRNVLIAEISSFEAVAIIQDTQPPQILSSFPANGAHYHYQDVERISVNVNDDLAGIDATESGVMMSMDGKRLLVAYQPVKKEISYQLEIPLEAGTHLWEIWVRDQTGNLATKQIHFSVN